MALIIEDGTNVTGADSYATTDEFNTYWSDRGKSTAVSAATGTDKDRALRKAVDYMESNYSGRWKGVRANATQALAFPRSGLVDSDGYPIETTEIPRHLKPAQIEFAAAIIDGIDLQKNVVAQGEIKRKRSKIDVLESETEYMGSQTQSGYAQRAEGYLREYVVGSGQAVRG